MIYILWDNRQQSKNRIADNKQAIERLGEQKDSLIYKGCIEVNARHDNTIKALDDRIRKLRESGRLSKEALTNLENSRGFTISLINALAPHKNCIKLVKQRNQLPPAPND